LESNILADQRIRIIHTAWSQINYLYSGWPSTSATIIAYESISNIQTPHELPQSWTLLVLGAIII
jgi:hypothetical protein